MAAQTTGATTVTRAPAAHKESVYRIVRSCPPNTVTSRPSTGRSMRNGSGIGELLTDLGHGGEKRTRGDGVADGDPHPGLVKSGKRVAPPDRVPAAPEPSAHPGPSTHEHERCH